MGNSSSSSRQSKTNSAYLDVPSRHESQRRSASAEPPPYSRYDSPSRSSSRNRRSLGLHLSSSRSSSRASLASNASKVSANQTKYPGSLNREYLKKPLRKESLDDVLETLRGYDTTILVDDSLSMIEHGKWDEARQALETLASMAAQYDSNGIDIYFLNNPRRGLNIRDLNQVRTLFDEVEPKGATPTGKRLEDLLQVYLSELEAADNAGNRQSVKPVNIIVITDGIPTDDVESVIVANARRLDQRNFPLCQVGIQFVQIGNHTKAARHLQSLDDNLSSKYNIRDIVDTVPFIGTIKGDMLVKVLVGAINRKIDKENPIEEHRRPSTRRR